MATGVCRICGAVIVKAGPGRPRTLCDAHRAAAYGKEHRALRKQWQARIDAGGAVCHSAICVMPSREIRPGDRWDLGHTPDGLAWTGPEHPKCNSADGGRRNRTQPGAASGTAAQLAARAPRDPGPPRPDVVHVEGCNCERTARAWGAWNSFCVGPNGGIGP